MSSTSSLERTINKVLSQAEADLISQIDSAFQESLANLEASRTKLESEYNRIIENAQKQSENLKRQIVGSSRLTARNRQLLIIENAVNSAFEKAKEELKSVNKDESYRNLIYKMIEDGISAIESDEIIVECNKNDAELVKKIITEISKKSRVKIKLSEQYLDSLGGIRIKTSDGSMTFDNTLESRIERLKPLIRKNIAQMLRGDQ